MEPRVCELCRKSSKLADIVLHPRQDCSKLGIIVEGSVDFLARHSWLECPRRGWQQVRNHELCWNKLEVDSRRLYYTQPAHQYALREDYRSLPESSGSTSCR